MKLTVFSAKSYDRKYINQVRDAKYSSSVDVVFQPAPLNKDTVSFAKDSDAVCAFVNDTADAPVVEALHSYGVKAILLRCAGYNNVDLTKAEELGIHVANVPSYSPEAVAEFAVALIQTLNRNTHRAYNRVREGNFNIEGLLGSTLHGKTVGVFGTGRIGFCLAKIMHGFGCKIIAHDVYQNEDFKKLGTYVDLETLFRESDIISLHCPLLDSTRHIINDENLAKMKKGVMLVNTSRGGLVDTKAAIEALKSKQLGALALDVYEGEGALFYNDHSGEIVEDDELMRLMTFPNALVCGHQAFFTEEALKEISEVTLHNLEDFAENRQCKNSLIKEGKAVVRRNTGPVRM